ncbi:CoB--CoM heterodisulfide reductase subunit C [Methanolobus vulcani]|jgi:heterodisulfide reductase subunit C|uniref:CoB--CoM heterodisulfide reductase subunit C n=1 Tax=Methanolobus vulcani TaxID=38026 RepID=A0A7Z7AX03_9EURY|nr:CoB--CoM heterodisulfide reductase subunit C [Methanolobus vulcani]MDK2826897.1 heterodisulfide reductase subunit [Methanolobus sp.]MDK2947723.1 heterodisulfide reductase subunit [Methanolobus sp.]SDF72507.1 CoB--CoM heterodisulfide reductase subunit C [Methanolobus vulcani]
MNEISRENINIKEQLKEASSSVLRCMQCGVCSSSCPSGRHTSLNIRKLVKIAGKDPDILKSEELWMCTTCYNCQERCPRGIDIVETILKIRSISAHQDIILPEHRAVCQMLLKYGHAVPINDNYKRKRTDIGLEELPETVHKYKDSLNEVKKLLASCGFQRFVEEDLNENQNKETSL